MSFVSNALKSFYRSVPLQTAILAGVSVSGRDRARIRRYFAENEFHRLQVGAGNNILKGWLNTNWFPIRPIGNGAIFLDAVKPFPLPDNSFDRIFSEHMIEHIPFGGGRSMLSECFRVLKPGGRIRIATPDMSFLMQLLSPQLTEVQQSYVSWAATNFLHDGQPHTPLSVVNNFVRDWGHVYIYDRPTLERLMADVGFSAITAYQVNESEDPELRGIEFPDRFSDVNFLQLETMSYEATKPA